MRVHGGARPLVIEAPQAAALIGDGATLVIESSGGGVGEPTKLLMAVRDRYAAEGRPRGVTIMHASGLGNQAGLGSDLLSAEGLLKRVVIGHYGMTPKLSELSGQDRFEAYCLPQGVLAQLFREIAAGRPGLLSHIGLGTFVDPRLGGGRVNGAAVEPIVELVTLAGREWIFYRSIPIDVAFIRGSSIDELGNMTMHEEAARLSEFSVAAAARNTGGIVVAQAKRLVPAHSLPAREVVVPGHLVDYIVIDPEQTQTAVDAYNPSYAGQERVPLTGITDGLDTHRRIIGERAFRELRPGFVANLGFGMPDAVAAIAFERNALDEITLTVEQGGTGGMPTQGLAFGAVWNPDAIVDQNLQFDFYDGGGLDCTCLGFAEIDAAGCVNSSQVAGRVFGVGGFINISQGAKKIVFCGTFTSGGLKVAVADGRLVIESEGRFRKFPERVGQLT
ncbi:MAG: acyl CoA:acetate/3-ketoacid CoA transferase, partial [Acidimicrobiia bacterium]|nr:acyl CoA:acetate/3-ketoacid CoA transferase [Acidimicrobiia bacterium]